LDMSAYPVASVCSTNKSLILGGGDSNLSWDSNDLVSMHIPFFLPHLVWKCAIESRNPSPVLAIAMYQLILSS
jgi:hypothetical protein